MVSRRCSLSDLILDRHSLSFTFDLFKDRPFVQIISVSLFYNHPSRCTSLQPSSSSPPPLWPAWSLLSRSVKPPASLPAPSAALLASVLSTSAALPLPTVRSLPAVAPTTAGSTRTTPPAAALCSRPAPVRRPAPACSQLFPASPLPPLHPPRLPLPRSLLSASHLLSRPSLPAAPPSLPFLP